jgi:hypothetical protein
VIKAPGLQAGHGCGPRGWPLRRAWAAVLDTLPGAWAGPLQRLVNDQIEGEPVFHRMTAAREVLDAFVRRFPGVIHADMSHSEICDRAEELAARADELGLGNCPEGADPWQAWARITDWVERHHGVPPVLRDESARVMAAPLSFRAVLPRVIVREQLAGLSKRARCPRWWRRQLRRYVARASEAAAVELGIVSSRTGQKYCSDRTVKRRQQQAAANEAALKARKIENGGGESMTLWDAMQTTVSNKAIRRGELMTRIRGAEEIADELELSGLFWTLTTPSRFHSRDHHTGKRNPRYQGATPRDAQLWLRERWALVRSRLKNRGARLMGVRVAEPHHDGCPHWHALIWCDPRHLDTVRDTITRTWLEDDGTEPGAKRYRTKWVHMQQGGAAGYVAKYVAKNIDAPLMYDGQPVHLQHVDDDAPPMDRPAELVEGQQVTAAARVEAWAAAWGIRQFQALGMPSVTVWRELRRVHPNAAKDRGDEDLERAYRAAHRGPGRRADWAEYCRAQGGVMRKRHEYRARVKTYEREKASGYDVGALERVPVGVTTDRTAAALQYMPSMRTTWGGPGYGAASRAAWTRLNNCALAEKRRPLAPWLFGRAKWEPKPAPGPRYFGDRTPFRAIVDALAEAIEQGRAGVALPVLADVPPLVVDADPEDFAQVVAALKARSHCAAITINPHPFALASEPAQHQPPAADRIAAMKARLAARAAGVRP